VVVQAVVLLPLLLINAMVSYYVAYYYVFYLVINIILICCVASIGSDTGGSVRQPASFCGVVGYKPAYGSLSRHGLISYASSLDTIGVIARDVMDSMLVYDQLRRSTSTLQSDTHTREKDMTMRARSSNDDNSLLVKFFNQSDCTYDENMSSEEKLTTLLTYVKSLENSDMAKGIIIGVPDEFFIQELDNKIVDLYMNSINALRDAGCVIKSISIPSLKQALQCYYVLACAEASSNLSRYDGIRYGGNKNVSKNTEDNNKLASDNLFAEIAQTRGECFGSVVKRRILTGTFVLSQTAYQEFYQNAINIRKQITHELNEALKGVHCIFGPTTPVFPFPSFSPPGFGPMMYNDIYTVPANLANIPAISIPAGVVSCHGTNVPIGMQFMSSADKEIDLFRVSLILENRLDFQSLRPTWLR
jgi:aspartyl-tRNA(Asn)/glutamyl-tRNA(Gln) amidotransferase subunit A